MGGGILQIVKEAELSEININPDITYFPYKKVYKKHTNFSFEFLEETEKSGTPAWSTTTTFTISKGYHLISNMYVEIVLPDLIDDVMSGGTNIRWSNAIAYALIDKIELIMGGSVIDTHTALWLDIWNEITDIENKDWTLVVKYDTIIGTTPASSTYDNKTKWYLPLQFFFNKNTALALPMHLLVEGQVQIKFKLKSLEKVVLQTGGTVGSETATNNKIQSFKLFSKRIYLAKDEFNMITKSLKTNNNIMIDTINAGTDITEDKSASSTIEISFDSPVKEFIWVFRHSSKILQANPRVPTTYAETRGNDWFSYHASSENSDLGIGSRDPFHKLTIKNGDNPLIEDKEADHFRTIEPYYHHAKVNTKYIYSYSFALKPHEYQPSGICNFTLNDKKCKFTFTSPTASHNVSIFALKYKNIRINITTKDGAPDTATISLSELGNYKVDDNRTIVSQEESFVNYSRPPAVKKPNLVKKKLLKPKKKLNNRNNKGWAGLAGGDTNSNIQGFL